MLINLDLSKINSTPVEFSVFRQTSAAGFITFKTCIRTHSRARIRFSDVFSGALVQTKTGGTRHQSPVV